MEFNYDPDILSRYSIYRDLYSKTFIQSFFGGSEKTKRSFQQDRIKILRMRTPYFIKKMKADLKRFELIQVDAPKNIVMGTVLDLKEFDNPSMATIQEKLKSYDLIMALFPTKNEIKYNRLQFLQSDSGLIFVKMTLSDMNVYKENIDTDMLNKNDDNKIADQEIYNSIIGHYNNSGVYTTYIPTTHISKIEIFKISQTFTGANDHKIKINLEKFEKSKKEQKDKEQKDTDTKEHNKIMFYELYNEIMKHITSFE